MQGHNPTRPGTNAGSGWSTARSGTTHVGYAANRRASRRAALGAFSCGDQLQQFLRIVEPLLEFGTQRLCRDLSRHAHLAGRRIGGYKPDLVDADGSVLAVPKSTFDFFNDVLGSGSAQSKCSYQVDELILGDLIRKMNAGQAGRRQQLRKTALRLPGFERNAIE